MRLFGIFLLTKALELTGVWGALLVFDFVMTVGAEDTAEMGLNYFVAHLAIPLTYYLGMGYLFWSLGFVFLSKVVLARAIKSSGGISSPSRFALVHFSGFLIHSLFLLLAPALLFGDFVIEDPAVWLIWLAICFIVYYSGDLAFRAVNWRFRERITR